MQGVYWGLVYIGLHLLARVQVVDIGQAWRGWREQEYKKKKGGWTDGEHPARTVRGKVHDPVPDLAAFAPDGVGDSLAVLGGAGPYGGHAMLGADDGRLVALRGPDRVFLASASRGCQANSREKVAGGDTYLVILCGRGASAGGSSQGLGGVPGLRSSLGARRCLFDLALAVGAVTVRIGRGGLWAHQRRRDAIVGDRRTSVSLSGAGRPCGRVVITHRRWAGSLRALEGLLSACGHHLSALLEGR